jgi:hypothetical protein
VKHDLALEDKLVPAATAQARELPSKSNTKEPHSAGPACTMLKDRAKSKFEGMLATVTFMESPSFSAWVPCAKPDIQHIKMSHVSFRGCEQSGLTLMQTCELENVTFINCKFDRTTFLDVKLSNVTFSRVNFADTTFYRLWLKNATLIDLHFSSLLWSRMSLENALIGEDSFIPYSDTTRFHFVRRPARSSKTRSRLISAYLCRDDLMCRLGRKRVWNRKIGNLQRAPQDQLLTRLADHDRIINRIMTYCFPGSSVHIYEYPKGAKIPGESESAEKLYCARFGTGLSNSSYMTTYFGSLHADTPVLTNLPERGVGSCTGLLLVDKQFSALALKHLYSRSFHLQCSAEGARKFLISRNDDVKLAKQLVLYFHWPEERLILAPNMHGWRFLLGIIRHQFSFVPNIHLRIGRSFWEHNKWPLGAKLVLDDVENCPLADAHKFAAPADRWSIKGDESTHRKNGTLLFIAFQTISSSKEREFVNELVNEVKKRRTGRPLFVRSTKGAEITYKCAGQFRGN